MSPRRVQECGFPSTPDILSVHGRVLIRSSAKGWTCHEQPLSTMKPTLRIPGSSLRPVFPEWRLWCVAYRARACVRSVAGHGSMRRRVAVREGEGEGIGAASLGPAQPSKQRFSDDGTSQAFTRHVECIGADKDSRRMHRARGVGRIAEPVRPRAEREVGQNDHHSVECIVKRSALSSERSKVSKARPAACRRRHFILSGGAGQPCDHTVSKGPEGMHCCKYEGRRRKYRRERGSPLEDRVKVAKQQTV
eukprot:810059-Pleurochrysis_carterae.AAC.2